MLEVVLRAEHHQFKPFMLRVLRPEPRGVDGFFIGAKACWTIAHSKAVSIISKVS